MPAKKSAPQSATSLSNDHTQKPTTLPALIRHRLDHALAEVTAPSKRRLLKFVLQNPAVRTDEIARECAIGYPPARIRELNHEVLNRFGLALKCSTPQSNLHNRFGTRTRVQCWRLELLPPPGGDR
jgi:predicted component of type VI protein secretion system